MPRSAFDCPPPSPSGGSEYPSPVRAQTTCQKLWLPGSNSSHSPPFLINDGGECLSLNRNRREALGLFRDTGFGPIQTDRRGRVSRRFGIGNLAGQDHAAL